MVRVKRTGEICSVDPETMRFLRAEEKRLRRSMQPGNGNGSGTVLSLDYVSTEDGDAWLEDKEDFTQTVAAGMLSQAFMERLTPREKEVYSFCMERGYSQHAYALASQLSVSRVSKIIAAIRKKAEIFFEKVSSF